MEFAQQEARTHIALATVSSGDQKAVYQSTTVPIANGTTAHNGRPTSQHLSVAIVDNAATTASAEVPAAATSASESAPNENGFRYGNITSLPAREPLDIQFKDVSYTANLGYFRGKYRRCVSVVTGVP